MHSPPLSSTLIGANQHDTTTDSHRNSALLSIQTDWQGTRHTQTFRTPCSIEEMASHCTAKSHIWVRTNAGDARQVKVNGAVRRWKRDANRIEIPCKYGLYEYFTLEARHIGDVLIPV